MATAYCLPIPGQPYTDPCTSEPAGIIAVGYLHSDFAPSGISVADLEDGTWWDARFAADEAFPIRFTKGDYPGPTFATQDEGFGEAGTEVTGADQTVNYKHLGIHYGNSGARTNIEFYNSILKKAGTYYFYWVDSGYKLWISTATVTVQPKPVILEGKKENESWEVMVSWSNINLPQTYDAPTTLYRS